MGVWGAGLYSGDFAADLRSSIRAVCRLPFDGEQLADILSQTESRAANNPDDEDHTTFWLVVADQFSRRGIVCDRVRDKALEIIDSGSDLTMLSKLEIKASELAKRQKVLEEVRARIAAPPAGTQPRPVLKKPQAFLMEVGDVLVYPTFDGACINPYFASKEKMTYWRRGGPVTWKQDSWGAVVIVDRGRAFDFLAWYRPLTLSTALVAKPALAALQGELWWKLERAGTCTAIHFRRMELEKIGTLPIDSGKLKRTFPDMRPGTRQAIDDISIANALSADPAGAAVTPRKRPYPTILGIEQILSS